MSVTTKNTKDAKRELPPGWRLVRLGDVCEVNPRRPQLDRADDEPTSFIPMEAVDAITGTIANLRTRPFGEVKKGYTWFVDNDVLFAKITPCMQNGKHAIARGLRGGFGFGTTEFHVLRAGPHITADWIWRFLRQPSFLQKATKEFTGSVGQQRLPDDYLKSLEIPLPPLPEQQRIAAFLKEQMAAVDKARAAAEARLEAVKILPSAFLRQVFPLPGQPLPEGWNWFKLAELCEVRLGKMLSPASKTGCRYIPYLRNANVQWNRFDLASVNEMDFSEEQELVLSLKPGDVLVCEGGEPGRAAIWDGQISRCCYQKTLHRLRPIDNAIDPHFIMYRLWRGALDAEFSGSNAQTTIAHLPLGRMKNLNLAIPSIAEQQRIVVILKAQMAAAEKARSAAEAELAAINALPAALLRRAFNGEL